MGRNGGAQSGNPRSYPTGGSMEPGDMGLPPLPMGSGPLRIG
jgi:hypothetical protein